MSKLRDRTWFARGGRHGLENRVADLSPILESFDTADMVTLDAGAAEGDISIWLASLFKHVTAVELMDQAYGVLERRAAEHEAITALHADITSWPIPSEYDIVFLLGSCITFRMTPRKRQFCASASQRLDLECSRAQVYASTSSATGLNPKKSRGTLQ